MRGVGGGLGGKQEGEKARRRESKKVLGAKSYST